MFKPFFVHINPHNPGKMSGKHPRGATVYVSPVENEPTRCRIQVALCSPKDEFNKAVGRAVAMAAEAEYVQQKNLSMWVRKISELTGVDSCKGSYDYLLKNFL